MAGSSIGGLKAAQKNKERYGDDFYAKIGAIGGTRSKTGGFGSPNVGADGLTGRERAGIAGRVGGLKSRRGPIVVIPVPNALEMETA